MAFDPSTIADAKKRTFTIDAADVDSAQTDFPVALVFNSANSNSEMVDDTAPDIHEDTVLLIESYNEADGSTTFVDSSASGHTVNIVGTVDHSTDQSKNSSSSIHVQGTDDCLWMADSADWDFGTGDFYIGLWVYFNSVAARQCFISNYQNSTTGLNFQYLKSPDRLAFGNGDPVLASGSWTPTVSTWYHVAVSRSGTDLRLFVNGAQVGSTATDSTNITGSSNSFLVGALYAGSYLYDLNAYVQSVQVIKGTALHTTTFTPPNRLFSVPTYKKLSVEQGGVQLPVEVDPGSWDTSNSKAVIYTNQGLSGSADSVLTVSWDETQDDNTDYVGLTTDADGSEIFSTSLTNWWSGTTATITFRAIIGASALSANANAFRLKLGRVTGNYTIDKMFVGEAATGGNAWDFADTPTQVFFNGSASVTVTSDGQLSDPVLLLIDSTKTLVISYYVSNDSGAYMTPPSGCSRYQNLTGDFAEDIAPTGFTSSTYYAPVTGIVPVSPAKAVWDSNFAAVYHMSQDPSGGTDCILDSTANANHGTPTGATSSGDLVDANFGKAIELDGDGDYITVSDSASLDIADAITLEALFYQDTVADEGLIEKGPLGSAHGVYRLSANTGAGSGITGAFNTNADSQSTGTLSATTWHYGAVTYNKTNIIPYLDGTAGTPNAYTTAISTDANDLYIGTYYATPGNDFDGKIAEIRISSAARSADWIALTNLSLTDTLGTWAAYGGGPETEEIRAYVEQTYGLKDILRILLAQEYHITERFIAALEQVYGLRLASALVQYFGDAPTIRRVMRQIYYSAPELRRYLLQPYGNHIDLRRILEQNYTIKGAIIAILSQQYGIASEEIRALLEQDFDLSDSDALRTKLEQIYLTAADGSSSSSDLTITINNKNV
jgi:hypothetical protein